MRRVGIVGVGLLGTAVASRLLAAGFEVTGHDARPEQVTRLAPRGLAPADSVAAAARGADAVFTILSTPAAVEAVWLEPGGLLDSAKPPTALLQMSTIGPGLATRLGEAAASRGLGFLDTPISGHSAAVTEGHGTIFAGGDAALVSACRPILDAIARRTIHVGPVGAASVTKLAANLLGGISAIALAEALVLGAKAGLEPAVLLDALRQSPVGSPMMDTRGRQMVQHRFDPYIRLDLFLKDFRLMLDEGARLGVPLPLTSVAQQLTTAASAAGHGEDDLSAVITTLESLAGLRR
jgi:3-hydroxyisobutyrate dehydrogenase-like beta-hydroxyacid dehydrogenase